MEQLYISQLSDIEKIVLKIAQEHLETSFSLEKSIGFKSWLAQVQAQAQQQQAQAQAHQTQAEAHQTQAQAQQSQAEEEKTTIIKKVIKKKKKLIM